MSENLHAKLLIEFDFNNICDKSDFGKGQTFDAIVRRLIKEEGLFGVCEDKFKILAIYRK